MSKQMSVRERFSLEFVTATGSVAHSGAASSGGILGSLPEFVLFDTVEEVSDITPAAPIAPGEDSTAAFDAVEELKALFGAVQNR